MALDNITFFFLCDFLAKFPLDVDWIRLPRHKSNNLETKASFLQQNDRALARHRLPDKTNEWELSNIIDKYLSTYEMQNAQFKKWHITSLRIFSIICEILILKKH